MEIEPSLGIKIWVLKFSGKIIKCFKYYFVFHKSLPFIFVIILVHAWVEYAVVTILITHLTDGLLHLPKAASIVNVQDGTTAFLVLVVAYMSDAYLGPFVSVVCTSLAYITGLWILYFAASHSKSIEIKILYAAVIFIGLGRAGRSISLKEFLGDQLRADGSCEDENQVESRRRALWRSAYILGIFASLFIYSNSSWIQLCKISGITMAAAFMLLLAGSSFYEFKKPTNSSPNTLLRVFYAALAKRHLPHSSSGTILLRWLDKAAIVESSLSVQEQVRRARLCTVEEVEEAKSLLNMVPLCTTFLVYGLLQATGNTFFFEQANYTDNHLGHVSNIPIIIFVVIKTSTCFIVMWFCDLLVPFFWGESTPRLVQLVRLGIGMLIAPCCCLVASKVEVYRVHKYVDYDISISFLYLVPQFSLLGLMDGLVSDGLQEFFSSLVPASLSKYGPSFAEFALGIGHFLGLISVLIFRNLFKDDLDKSRLGVYYGKLGFVCLGNLLLYLCVVPYYLKQSPSADEATDDQLESLEETMNQVSN